MFGLHKDSETNGRGFATGPDPLPATQYVDMRDAIIAGLKQDIATLQSQLQCVTTERDQYITQYTQVKQVSEDARLHISVLNEMIDDLIAERDAARSWAAAWRRAATYERATTMWPPTVARAVRSYRASGSLNRRASRAADARRAAEAADAQEWR